MANLAEIQAAKAAKDAAKGAAKGSPLPKPASPSPAAPVKAAAPAARTAPDVPPAATPPAPRNDPGAIAEARTMAKLGELSPNPLNPRTNIDPDSPKMRELRQSLKEQQLHPVPVVTVEHFRRVFHDTPYVNQVGRSGFVIIGGGRRFVAATAEGLLSLKINVLHGDRAPQTPADWMSLTLEENVHQEPLTVMQTARGVKEMLQLSSGRSVAQTMKKSPGWVSQYQQLTELPAEVQDVIEAAPFSLRQARRVYDMPNPAAQLQEALSIKARLLNQELPETPAEAEPQTPVDPEPQPVKRTGRPSYTPAQKLSSRLVKVDRDTVLDALLLRFPGVDRTALEALLQEPAPEGESV
ncbi:ParB/RepB/Spo0J family partition protein [Actinoplanes sp. G11-F43]|uniref:ParB/RepB/Spo0J family partition protein n=1 Tax=Actinoplanes sp. G11-F43 TaxID=3424130 RepID=UPI003D337B94